MGKLDPFKAAMTRALAEVRKVGNMRKYGEQAAAMIRLRTRLGDGVSKDGGTKSKLKALAESTKEERRRLAKQGDLSPLTSPGKSNLTRTGEYLDSFQVTQVAVGEVRIGPKGARGRGEPSNEQLGKYLAEGGRPHNNLSKTEIKRINDTVSKDVKEIVDRYLTTKKT